MARLYFLLLLLVSLLSYQTLWSQATRAILSQPEQLILYRGILNRVQCAIPDGSNNFNVRGNNLTLSPVEGVAGAYDVLVRGREEASILFLGQYGDTISTHVFQVWDLPEVKLRLNELKNNDTTDVLSKGILKLSFDSSSPFLPKNPEVNRWVLTRTDNNQVIEGSGSELSQQALIAINEAPGGLRIAIDVFYSLPGISERLIRGAVVKKKP
jgi:hypothetical protein